MQIKSYLPHAAVIVAGLSTATACTALPGPIYAEYVGRWVENTEVNLVSTWGIPEKTYSLETGGRIVEYTREQEGDIVCTTRFMIDENGRIVNYWYLGSKCKPPKGT